MRQATNLRAALAAARVGTRLEPDPLVRAFRQTSQNGSLLVRADDEVPSKIVSQWVDNLSFKVGRVEQRQHARASARRTNSTAPIPRPPAKSALVSAPTTSCIE